MQTAFTQGSSNIRKVYQELIDLDIKLRVGTGDKEGSLLVTPPKPGSLTSEIKKVIQQYKPGLMTLLKGGKVHDFQESLEKGGNIIHRPFFTAVYEKAFYNYDHCHVTRSGDTIAQKKGCDVIIYLTNDRVYRIDEKLRYEFWNDILLEYMSSDRTKSPGWIEKDLGIDYLNYAFVYQKQSYLFPWQQLKIAWDENKTKWMALAESKQDGFRIVPAQNDTYTTLSCAVPTDLLINTVKDAMVISL